MDYFKNIHKITVNKEDWRNSRCTCRFYLKDNMCFHVPIVCEKANICSFDLALMSKKIGKKPKRGRKSRRKNCLIRDEPPNPSPTNPSPPNPSPPNSSPSNPSLPATSLPATSLPNPSLPATSKSRSKRAAGECVTEPRVTRRTKKN